MKVTNIIMYMDGGTASIATDDGTYCIDKRLLTKTPNALYKDYPLKDNSNLISKTIELKKELLAALKIYSSANDLSEYYLQMINDINKILNEN